MFFLSLEGRSVYLQSFLTSLLNPGPMLWKKIPE